MSDINVLHIDDEMDFAASLGRRLSRRGMDVHAADGGESALKVLKQTSIDVVLLDIKMPGMDGIKTLGRIKSQHPQVEVIMLTALANTDTVLSSLAMGAFDYLMKPAEIDDIVQKIKDAAKQRKRNLEQGAP